MSIVYWLVIPVVIVVLWYTGAIRPTGLLGRSRAEEESERQRDAAARFLDKDK